MLQEGAAAATTTTTVVAMGVALVVVIVVAVLVVQGLCERGVTNMAAALSLRSRRRSYRPKEKEIMAWCDTE